VKILTVLGTRPEAIKLAPVLRELSRRAGNGAVRTRVCVTAQHRQMLDQVLDVFRITPDIDLNLMQEAQTPSQVAARVLSQLEPILEAERPDWMVVQGDTTTVMASAIAANHLRVRVAHVEAGLRTGDRSRPFPEEMNRLIADRVSDWHFAPTERARQNLRREGIEDRSIRVTGNTVVDAVLDVAAQPCPRGVSTLLEPDTRLVLVTAHRRESFGPALEAVCRAVRQLAVLFDDIRVVYPVHLNPHVWRPVHQSLRNVPRVRLIPPVDYLTLVHLMKNSTLILTDSGGIQEEAPSLGVPVLVLRETTERPEAVEAGAARVVGTDPDRIVAEGGRLLTDPAAHAAMVSGRSPFGDGRAAQRIADALIHGDCEQFVARPQEGG
jgi:UDP-N-acetylglucosamine 2-epimerase (non-hydrolysing)